MAEPTVDPKPLPNLVRRPDRVINDGAVVATVDGSRQLGKQFAKPVDRPKPWYIVLPNSPICTASELLAMFALILIFFVLPFEIAFVDAPNVPDARDGLYIFNRSIDFIFLIDLGLTFFVAFAKVEDGSGIPEDDEEALDDEASGGSGGGILKQKVNYEFGLLPIACRYLRGWLLLDAFSMIPSGFDIYFAVVGAAGSDDDDDGDGSPGHATAATLRMLSEAALDADGGAGAGSPNGLGAARLTRTLKLVKIMRMARMLKMLRLLRLTKLLKFMQKDGPAKQALAYLTVALAEHTRKLRVARLMLIMLLIAHMMTCALGLSATFGEQKLHSWWGTHGYCWPDDLYQLGPHEPLKSRCVDAADQYLICFHLALSLCFKIPFGPFVLQGPGEAYFHNTASNVMFQTHEHAAFVFVGLIGALNGMFITGTFVAVVSAKDGATVTEKVTSFCRKYNVSHTSRKTMLTYFQSLGELSGTAPSGDLFYKLSPNLLVELILDVHGKWLLNLPFAPCLYRNPYTGADRLAAHKKIGGALLTKITLAMVPALYIQRERPSSGRLYVVVKGLALQMTTRGLLKAADSWGGYSLLVSSNSDKHKASLTGTVRALTSLQVVYIDAEKFHRIPHDNPEVMPAFTRMRVWALLRRLSYGIIRAAVKERMMLDRSSDVGSPDARPPGTSISDIDEVVMQAQAVADITRHASSAKLLNGESGGGGGGASVAVIQASIEPLAAQVTALQHRMGGVERQLARLCQLLERPGSGVGGAGQSRPTSTPTQQQQQQQQQQQPTHGFFSGFQRPMGQSQDDAIDPLVV